MERAAQSGAFYTAFLLLLYCSCTVLYYFALFYTVHLLFFTVCMLKMLTLIADLVRELPNEWQQRVYGPLHSTDWWISVLRIAIYMPHYLLSFPAEIMENCP